MLDKCSCSRRPKVKERLAKSFFWSVTACRMETPWLSSRLTAVCRACAAFVQSRIAAVPEREEFRRMRSTDGSRSNLLWQVCVCACVCVVCVCV